MSYFSERAADRPSLAMRVIGTFAVIMIALVTAPSAATDRLNTLVAATLVNAVCKKRRRSIG